MKILKINFPNKAGEILSAKLSLPTGKRPENFALFAHCFTCNKNFNAVRNIATTLTAHGFGVLSFDFTGLGESEGEFEDTNFSSNVEDLVEAAEYLENNYTAPSLIIGHSLGGAAAIYAASQIPSIKAIATVGAPADVARVRHLIDDEIELIEQKGEATVILEGRPFKIKKQFLKDIHGYRLLNVLDKLRKPILIMHSPQDSTVGIENAEKLYTAAHHPKSFISLNGADHLLNDKQDSQYAGDVTAAWVSRYLQ